MGVWKENNNDPWKGMDIEPPGKEKAKYPAARAIAAVMGFSSLLGVLWFYPDLTISDKLSGIISGVVGLLAAVIPRKDVNQNYRLGSLIIVLCSAGLLSEVVNIFNHLNLNSKWGIDWGGVVFGVIFLWAFSVMIIEVLKKREETPNKAPKPTQ